MNKKIKIWLIIALALVLTGTIIVGSIMTMFKWNLKEFATKTYQAEYEITEEYKNISISTKTADILFLPSEGDRTSVVCQEEKNLKYSVMVRDNTLVIELVDTRKWYDHISFNFTAPKITVHIPEGEYGKLYINGTTGDVEIPQAFCFEDIDICETTGNVKVNSSVLKNIKIKTTTGKIKLQELSAEGLELSVTTGVIEILDVNCKKTVNAKVTTGSATFEGLRCKNIISKGTTGGLTLKNVIAAEKFSLERSTGDIKFDNCDAAELFIKTTTGSVKGSLLTEKIFFTDTSTGSIDVPKTTSGGKCEVKTTTGSIKINITH